MIKRFWLSPVFLKKEREFWGAFVHHRNLFNKGKGELSILTPLIQIIAVVYGFANQDVIKDNWLLISVIAVLYHALYYVIGWYWEQRRIWAIESEWGNNKKRNPLAGELRDGLEAVLSSRRG